MAKQPKYSMTQVAKYLAKAPATVNAYITDLEKQISNLAKHRSGSIQRKGYE